MSAAHVLYDKFEEICCKLEKFMQCSTQANKNELDTDSLMEGLQDSLEISNNYFVKFTDDLQYSKPEDESKVREKFNNFTEFEKKAVVKLMELIWRVGYIEEASDLEKRQFWHEKLRSIYNNEVM